MLLILSMADGNERGPQYMEQALAAIHQANPERLPLSLEFIRRGDELRLACRVPHELCAVIERQLYAHYPDAKIAMVSDGISVPPSRAEKQTLSIRLHTDLFPIKRYNQFEDALNRVSADPVTTVLHAIQSNSKQPFQISVSLTLRPARNWDLRANVQHLRRLNRVFFRSHPRLSDLYISLASLAWPLCFSAWILSRFARSRHETVTDRSIFTSSPRAHDREEDLQAAADKISRPLFDATLQITITTNCELLPAAEAKLREVAGAFGTFNGRRAKFRGCKRPRRFLLSAEEVATLWHPPTETIQTASLKSAVNRDREAPLELPIPQNTPEITVLGVTAFRGAFKKFGLLPEDRFRHTALLGKTGMGKSTLLHRQIVSDIVANQGVGVVDPHGDLIEAILPCIPKHRTNDVILFDPADRDHPLAFNVLDCRDPTERPLVASAVVSAFKKLYGDSWGPRLEHILRNALLALLDVPGTTLVSLVRMLSDAGYRREIERQIKDPLIANFWQKEFAGMPPKLQAEAIAPIQNKVGQFVSSPVIRNIIGQPKNKLDIRTAMDEGKILLAVLSKGKVGDDVSMLLGSFLVSQIQLAAMSRANEPADRRRDFFLYVDEFQNYATDSFATILSEARKYRLSLTIANQYLAQLDEPTLHAVFGNVGTLACFQVGAKDAEILAEQLGPSIETQDLMNIPCYHAYIRLLIDGQPSRPFTMRTLQMRTRKSSRSRPVTIRRNSRHRYATARPMVESLVAGNRRG